MDQVIFLRNKDNLNSILSENSEIGIVLPERHTIDVVSAGLSLFLSLKASGKNVQIVSKTTPLVEHSNLFGIDKIRKNFDGKIRKLTISVPYVEGEIEKVSYDKDETNRRLLVNFIAEENGITFAENEVEYIRKGTVPQLMILLGIDTKNDLNGYDDLKSGTKFIVINNSQVKDLQGEISYQDSAFSSISEIVGKIIAMHGLVIDRDIAQNLLDGIISSTNNFTSERTSSTAFEVTGVLMRGGARRKKSNERPQQRQSGLENLIKFDNRNDNKRDERKHEDRRGNMSRPQNNPQVQDKVQVPQPVNNSMPTAFGPIEEDLEEFESTPVIDVQPQQDSALPQKEEKKEKIPSDWFVPKIYKGDKTN